MRHGQWHRWTGRWRLNATLMLLTPLLLSACAPGMPTPLEAGISCPALGVLMPSIDLAVNELWRTECTTWVAPWDAPAQDGKATLSW